MSKREQRGMVMKKKQEIEFRYYEVPEGELVLPLIGKSWIREYGNDTVARLHFHNLMEIGYCIDGHGEMTFADEILAYGPGTLTVIPPNFPHHTNSVPYTKSYWEYLFFDVPEVLRCFYPEDPLFIQKITEAVNRDARCLRVEENRQLAELVRMIMDECRDRKSFSGECIKGMLSE